MAGRFSRPVLPGEPLTVSVWRQDGSDTALFQTTRQDGTVVIDRGRLQVREPTAACWQKPPPDRSPRS